MINKIKGDFEEVDGDKYLIITSENGDIMQKYQEVFDKIIYLLAITVTIRSVTKKMINIIVNFFPG